MDLEAVAARSRLRSGRCCWWLHTPARAAHVRVVLPPCGKVAREQRVVGPDRVLLAGARGALRTELAVALAQAGHAVDAEELLAMLPAIGLHRLTEHALSSPPRVVVAQPHARWRSHTASRAARGVDFHCLRV